MGPFARPITNADYAPRLLYRKKLVGSVAASLTQKLSLKWVIYTSGFPLSQCIFRVIFILLFFKNTPAEREISLS
jgi:hypothetical protein